MKLDRDTIMWVIENLTDYDHEYDRGPRAQEMTFRKGQEEHTYKYFFAGDIREWLAGELHQRWMSFLPEELPKQYEITDITHRVVECTCGWKKSFEINHADKTFIENDAELARVSYDHYHEAIKEIMERYQWEE